jgi:hypothetical protein
MVERGQDNPGGPPEWTDAALVAYAIAASGWEPTVVVEAPGVDTLGRAWAEV